MKTETMTFGPLRLYRPVCLRFPHGFYGGPISYERTDDKNAGPLIVVALSQGDNQRATQMHHVAYRLSTLRGRHQNGLMSVCKSCHRRIEFRSNRSKRSFGDAIKEALALRARKRCSEQTKNSPQLGKPAADAGHGSG